MTDPNVYEVGRLEDIHGRRLVVGVNYDAVTIGVYDLTIAQVEEFARVLEAAYLAARATQQDDADDLPAGPQPLGIPKDVLTELVETNARLLEPLETGLPKIRTYRASERSPEDDPELDQHYGPCCEAGTCDA